jgi:glycerophosphoryl diester phosphodiesterase
MKCLLGLIIVFGTLASCNKAVIDKNIEIYGHAGTSLHRDRAIFPANSFKSIEYAIDGLDADGVEIDVQITKDTVMVLFHDPFLNQSSNWDGCVGDYTFKELQELPLDYSKYRIASLAEVLIFMKSRNKKVYLDTKIFDYCSNSLVDQTKFQIALDKALNEAQIVDFENIMLGMLDVDYLNSINYPNKCYESGNVENTVKLALLYGIKNVLFEKDLINKESAEYLENSTLNWGVFNVKDKWTIQKVVKFTPDFIISDNISTAKYKSN